MQSAHALDATYTSGVLNMRVGLGRISHLYYYLSEGQRRKNRKDNKEEERPRQHRCRFFCPHKTLGFRLARMSDVRRAARGNAGKIVHQSSGDRNGGFRLILFPSCRCRFRVLNSLLRSLQFFDLHFQFLLHVICSARTLIWDVKRHTPMHASNYATRLGVWHIYQRPIGG